MRSEIWELRGGVSILISFFSAFLFCPPFSCWLAFWRLRVPFWRIRHFVGFVFLFLYIPWPFILWNFSIWVFDFAHVFALLITSTYAFSVNNSVCGGLWISLWYIFLTRGFCLFYCCSMIILSIRLVDGGFQNSNYSMLFAIFGDM